MYIIIGGGGMVGGELAQRLMQNKHDVVVVDDHGDVCDKIYAQTGVVAVNGSVSRVDVLVEAGIEKADIIVAATGSDANNLACAVLAKSFGVPKIIVRMRDPNYENAYRLAGANKIVRVTDMMVNHLTMDIENPELRREASIGNGRADVFMVNVPEGASVIGKTVKDIAQSKNFPSQCVFMAVYNQHKNLFSIPRGDHIIDAGDEIFLVSTAENIKKAVDFLTARKTKHSFQLVKT